MRLLLYIVAMCSALLVGCTTNEHTAALIRHAEDIAADHPDSALMIMRSVNPRTVHGKHDRAHYQLVYSESLYYNAIDSDNDSLTRSMAKYYLYDDNHAERARAMYQHALVRVNAKNNAEAMYYLIEAEKSLAYVNNPRLAGVVHRAKGEIYGEECLFANSLMEYETANKYFDICDLAYHKLATLYDIGKVYGIIKEYERSIEILIPLIDMCLDIGNSKLLGAIIIELSQNYILTDKIDECSHLVDLFEQNDCAKYFDQEYYLLKAIVEAHFNARDSALMYLAKALEYPFNDYFQAEFLAHIVYKKLNCLDEALYYLSLSEQRQDDIILEVLQQPVLNVQIELLRNDLESERQQLRHNKSVTIILFVVFVLLVFVLLLYLRFRKVKQDRDIANYVSIINELQQSIKEVNLASEEKFAELHLNDFITINEMCEILYTYGDTSQLSSKLTNGVYNCIELIRSNQEYLEKLEAIINHNHDNIFVALRNSSPKLNEKELRFVLYLMLGFSYRSISILIGVDTAAVSRLKYKVKTKLKEVNNEHLLNVVVGRKL